MIKFINFKSADLNKVAALRWNDYDKTALVMSATGRIFQTRDEGLSLVIGKDTPVLVYESEDVKYDSFETKEATICNLKAGGIALRWDSCPNSVFFIYANGTFTTANTTTIDEIIYLNGGKAKSFDMSSFSGMKLKYNDKEGHYCFDEAQWKTIKAKS